MKRISISPTAWHYKLAQYGHLDEDYGQTDICRYFWALVRGVAKAPAIALFCAAVLLALAVMPLMCLYVWAAYGAFEPDVLAFVGFELWVGAAVITSVVWARDKYQTRREAQPGLVRSAYRGWKEKTCVLVDVQGHDDNGNQRAA